MYTDIRKKHGPLAVAIVLMLLVGTLLLGRFARVSGQNVTEEGAEAIKEAVRQSALQCYVVEGVYPPDLAYLEEHYGLRVNTRDYYVVYDAFASNQPPDVRVTGRSAGRGSRQ